MTHLALSSKISSVTTSSSPAGALASFFGAAFFFPFASAFSNSFFLANSSFFFSFSFIFSNNSLKGKSLNFSLTLFKEKFSNISCFGRIFGLLIVWYSSSGGIGNSSGSGNLGSGITFK